MKSINLTSAIVTLIFTACSTSPGATNGKVSSTMLPGPQASEFSSPTDKSTLALNFEGEDSSLNDLERRELRTLVEARAGNSDQMTAYVAAWPDRVAGDSASTGGETKTPTRESIRDAHRRLRAVKRGLRQSNFDGDIIVINMAASPNTLNRVRNPESAAIRSAYEKVDSNVESKYKEIARKMQDSGGFGKTVVVLAEHIP